MHNLFPIFFGFSYFVVFHSDIHCVKYADTQASSDVYFSFYDFGLIQENIDIILSIYGKAQIKKIQHLGIIYTVIRKK